VARNREDSDQDPLAQAVTPSAMARTARNPGHTRAVTNHGAVQSRSPTLPQYTRALVASSNRPYTCRRASRSLPRTVRVTHRFRPLEASLPAYTRSYQLFGPRLRVEHGTRPRHEGWPTDGQSDLRQHRNCGADLERTTGFEPATLTLARSFATTSLPATPHVYQCFPGLLTYRS